MKKSFPKVFFIIFCAIFITIISIVFFRVDFLKQENTGSTSSVISINNLHVDAVFNQNNTINITENFDVTFNQSGLTEVVRLVPYASYVYRNFEGSLDKKVLISKVTNISGSGDFGEECKVYTDEITGYITIGLKASSTVPNNAKRSYTISYTYDFGRDFNKDFDDFYLNLVGTSTNTVIYNVSFMVALPTDVSFAENIAVYYGKEGSTTQLNVGNSGNIITGSVSLLEAYEGITFRAVYKEGFIGGSIPVSMTAIISVILGACLIGLAVIFMLRFKQRKDFAKPVELLVPEGITPLKADFYHNGKCTNKAIIATIIYLAQKGYLKINELEDKEIELIRAGEMKDNEDGSAKAIYNALFKGVGNRIKLSDIGLDFVASSNAVLTSEKVKGEAALYDPKAKKSHNKLKTAAIITAAVICFCLFATVALYLGFFADYFSFRLVVISVILGAICILMFTKNNWIIGIILTAFAFALMLFMYIEGGYAYVDGAYLILIAIVLAGVGLSLLGGESKYSKDGEIKKGRVLGFKEFIKKCEVSQIKAFAEENPNYYFDVLPYAYVFGLSDVWIKKFESINLSMPEWATSNGSTLTDVYVFNSMFNNFTVKSAVMQSRLISSQIQGFSSGSSGNGPTSGGSWRSGGGGFGGGGFSGGGGGGGGFGAR